MTDVTIDRASVDVDREIAAVTAFGVPTAPSPPDEPLSDDAWRVLTMAVRSQRVSGLLARAIATGEWPVTETQLDEASEIHVPQCGWVLGLERRMLELADLFEQEHLPYRVLKGSALAHLDYGDPAERCFGDVDVVVPSARFTDACDVLGRIGGERRFPEPRPGFDAEFSKGASFRLPNRQEIDLHRTLVLGWFGLRLDPDDLFASSEEFVVASKRVPALARPERLVHACIHASLGNPVPRWLPLRDVVQVTLGTTDVDAVLRRARAWRCEIVVADAIRQAWSRLGLTVDHDLVRWAHDYPTTDDERARLAAYRGDGRSHARLALAGVSAVSGWRRRGRYLHAILLPLRADRRIPTATRLRHGVNAIRAWSGR